MSSRLVRWMTLVVLAGACGVRAQEASPEAAEPMAALQGGTQAVAREGWEIDWDAPVTLGIFSGDEGVSGQGDLLLPLYRYESGLLFFNPRVSASDSHQEETNLGIGLRHLVDARCPFILGANLYYDGRWSRYNNRFDQLGVGLELLGSRVDLRANYYLPEQDRYRIDTVRAESVTQTERISQVADNWFEPYAQGNQILQDYGDRLTTRRTLVTETSWQIYDRYEAALEGFDAEAGWRLPLLEDWAATRLFVGFQYFDNPFGKDFKGAKGRMEVRLFNDLLTLDAHLYEDEDLNLTDYLVGARLRLPLGLPGGKPALRQGNGGDLAARLTEMVMRDPKVQTRESKFVADPALQGVDTISQTTVTQQADKEGTAVVMTDVVFVDGKNGDDANSGTEEAPKATIQGGINSAYGQQHVYVYEGTYITPVNVTEGVSLMGSGCPIPASGGKAFGNGVHPVINGGVIMQDNTLVQGFDISNVRFDANGHRSYGYGVSSSAENITLRCNDIHDNLHGFYLDRIGDVNVLMENNTFHDNTFIGAYIDAEGASGSYFVVSRDNVFLRNNINGMLLRANNYDVAMAIIDGDTAGDHRNEGLRIELNSEFVSLLSITDTRADDNIDSGIRAEVKSDGIAAALVGTPAALLGLVGEVTGLPPELEALLASSGPVSANNNGGHGIELNVQGGMIGAAALFDVRAAGNAGDGAHIEVAGDLAGIGLVASSQNTMELLQLGATALGLLAPGLELPSIPASPLGPCVFNGNGGDGLEMDVGGGALALGAFLGVSTQGNTDDGTDLYVVSDSIAAGLLARVEALGNSDDGIDMLVGGGDLGLGVLLDGRANNNADDGVDLEVHSQRAAIALMASTDPLRSLADILNAEADLAPPLVVHGDRWGAFEASGNGDYGVYADVWGGNLATGVFLDIRANNNRSTGFSADIWSEYGTALGLAGSSDTLFEIVPPILGDILAGDPEAIPVPAYTPMGPMTAYGNGNSGFELMVDGEDAIGMAGGVLASSTDFGAGLYLGVTATDGDAFAALYDITANNNAGQGVDIEVESALDQATLSLINVTAEGNAEEGIRIETSADDDAYVLLTGVEANGNGTQGIRLTASSGDDIGMAFSAITFTGNAQQGVLLDLNAGNLTLGWAGETAIDEFRAQFGSYDILGASDSLYYLMPSGPAVFSGNGGPDVEFIP